MPPRSGYFAAPVLSERMLQWVLRLASAALFALVWELLARRVGSLLLPTFSGTARALLRLSASLELWKALAISNQALVLGFVLAATAGILAGSAMARWPAVDRWSSPWVTILLVTPISALIPILIMAAGLGLAARVLVIFWYAVVTVAVNTRAGLRTVDADWVEMSRSFGATGAQLWRTTLFPGAMPAILTGLRLGLARAVAGMVAMELLFIAVGVGRLISDFQGRFEAAELYAAVLVILAEAILLMQACHWFERRAVPWAVPAVSE